MIFTEIKATFTDGKALIYAFPTKNGGTLLVKSELENDVLIVSFSRDVATGNGSGNHVKLAVSLYQSWRWWESFSGVEYKDDNIVLLPDWEAIPVPNSIEATLADVLFTEEKS